ncbi:MAG: hypothetical protein ACK4F9_01720 [Brevinematia bacterium]
MKFTITEDTVLYERGCKRYYFCGMEWELDELKANRAFTFQGFGE